MSWKEIIAARRLARDVTGRERHLVLLLATHAAVDGGLITVSARTLANELGSFESTVRTLLHRLEGRGLVAEVKKAGQHKARTLRLCLPVQTSEQPDPLSNQTSEQPGPLSDQATPRSVRGPSSPAPCDGANLPDLRVASLQTSELRASRPPSCSEPKDLKVQERVRTDRGEAPPSPRTPIALHPKSWPIGCHHQPPCSSRSACERRHEQLVREQARTFRAEVAG